MKASMELDKLGVGILQLQLVDCIPLGVDLAKALLSISLRFMGQLNLRARL